MLWTFKKHKPAPSCWWNKTEIKLISCGITADLRWKKSVPFSASENCPKYYSQLVLNGRLSPSAALWRKIPIIFSIFLWNMLNALVGNIVKRCLCLPWERANPEIHDSQFTLPSWNCWVQKEGTCGFDSLTVPLLTEIQRHASVVFLAGVLQYCCASYCKLGFSNGRCFVFLLGVGAFWLNQ